MILVNKNIVRNEDTGYDTTRARLEVTAVWPQRQ